MSVLAVCGVAATGCSTSFDLAPVRDAKVVAPERRGSVDGFRGDSRLREATRILVLMPDGDGAGVRDNGTPYNSGVAFLEAALVAQGRVPVVASRSVPSYAGAGVAVCAEKTCEAKGDDLEHALQMGREVRADLVLQLTTPLTAEPVLARYVDGRTGEVLLVGTFFATPGRVSLSRLPTDADLAFACLRAGGRPEVVHDYVKKEHGGSCHYGPSPMAATGWTMAVVGGVVALLGFANDTSVAKTAGLVVGGGGALLGFLGDRSMDEAAFRKRIADELPGLWSATPIAASRERTIAEALVAPLQGGAP